MCVDRAFASPKFHGLLKCLQGAGIGQLPTVTAHGKNTNVLIHGVFVSMEGGVEPASKESRRSQLYVLETIPSTRCPCRVKHQNKVIKHQIYLISKDQKTKTY